MKYLNLKVRFLKIMATIDRFENADYILRFTVQLVAFLCVILFLSMLGSCGSIKKAVSRSRTTAQITEQTLRDSTVHSSVDSVRVRRDSSNVSVKKDSAYDSRVTIEEEIDYNNAQVSKIKRKTTFEDKGRYVFESLQKQVSEDSASLRKEVTAIKAELRAKDSTGTITSFSKDVTRKRFPYWLLIVVALVGAGIGFYIANALPGWSKWVFAIIKKFKS